MHTLFSSPKYLFKFSIIIILVSLTIFVFICICDYILYNRGIASKLHLDMWDWFAIVIATISLFFNVLTWWSQDQTKENTTRLDTKDYREMLISSYYNIVRNIINIYSLEEYLKDKYSDYYPSEVCLLKLKLYLFDTSQISLQNISNSYYGIFQRVAEICNYFNIHIDTTVKHFSSGLIAVDVKQRDMEMIKRMNWHVAWELKKSIDFICPQEEEINRNMIFNIFGSAVDNFCSVTDYYYGVNVPLYLKTNDAKFLKIICSNNADSEDIIKKLNYIIKYRTTEKTGISFRIPLIPLR